jgi:hypothetical protein
MNDTQPTLPSLPQEKSQRTGVSDRHGSGIIEGTDILYGAKTRAQVPLPFSVWVRRRCKWWPGSERYGGLVDRIILAALIAPGVAWAGLSFGWLPAIFILAEAVVILEIVYRIATGTMLGD